MGANLKTRRSGVIGIVVAIGAVLLLLTAGTAAGMTLSEIRNRTGESPINNPFGSGSSSGCYMTDQYWTSPSTAEIPTAQSVISKVGGRSIMPSTDKIEKILVDVRAAGVNPAVAIATWGKEQNFANPNYAFGAGASSSFEDQLTKHIKTLTDARDNKGYYGNRPAGTPIQVWWIDIYTPESDTRNNVTEDRGIFFTFLKQLVPGQIQCPTVGGSSGNFYNPLGGYFNRISGENSTPHPTDANGHGLFESTPFGSDFANTADGAVDYDIENGARFPVYATFDSKIVKTTPQYYSGNYNNGRGGSGAGILWLLSNDGASGAIYAHIEFASGIKDGATVQRGQQIGTIALHCGASGANSQQCVSFGGSDHLHFQIYVNKKGVAHKDINALFN